MVVVGIANNTNLKQTKQKQKLATNQRGTKINQITYIINIIITLEFGFNFSQRNIFAKLQFDKILSTVNNLNGAIWIHLDNI